MAIGRQMKNTALTAAQDTKTFWTDGRETPYRIVSDREFFNDGFSEASRDDACIVVLDRPMDWLEDTEILEMAERVRSFQATHQEVN